MRCARQRCRAERGKHSSIARMIPGAPSETTSTGSPRPRPRMSWKNARTVSVSSFEPAISASSTLRPSVADAPGRQHRLAGLTRPQPLGDAVDEEVDDPVLGQIAAREPLVFRPQPFGDLAHRCPRQQPPAVLVGEGILDVARRQPARVELDRQLLQRLGPAAERGTDRRDERLGRVTHLRCRVFDHPLRRPDLPAPIAVPVTRRRALGPLVALAPDCVGDLAFERLLHDQPQRQVHEV